MNVLSCNIRCCVAEDGPNDWNCRKGLCVEVIRSREPDLICFQEMWSPQFADLVSAFPDYRCHAMADEPAGRHPVVGMFYRDAAFTLLSAGGYWLSESPHVPGSRSWDSAYVRLANWIRLEDNATGVEFRVVNTHLDNESQTARENQARLLVEDASAYAADYPQILTGDMNCDVRNRTIRILKADGWSDTYASVHGAGDPGHTYHEYLGEEYGETDIGKMDWIFVRGRVQTRDATIIRDSVAGQFPSDHYFVSSDIVPQPAGENGAPGCELPPRG